MPHPTRTLRYLPIAQDQTGNPPAAGLPLAEEPQGHAEIPREAKERKKPPAMLTKGANVLWEVQCADAPAPAPGMS